MAKTFVLSYDAHTDNDGMRQIQLELAEAQTVVVLSSVWLEGKFAETGAWPTKETREPYRKELTAHVRGLVPNLTAHSTHVTMMQEALRHATDIAQDGTTSRQLGIRSMASRTKDLARPLVLEPLADGKLRLQYPHLNSDILLDGEFPPNAEFLSACAHIEEEQLRVDVKFKNTAAPPAESAEEPAEKPAETPAESTQGDVVAELWAVAEKLQSQLDELDAKREITENLIQAMDAQRQQLESVLNTLLERL